MCVVSGCRGRRRRWNMSSTTSMAMIYFFFLLLSLMPTLTYQNISGEDAQQYTADTSVVVEAEQLPASTDNDDAQIVKRQRQQHGEDDNSSLQEKPHHTYHVISINFDNVETPFAIALWVFIATIAKIGFHMANKLSLIFPESVLLIVLGIIIGLLLFYTQLMVVSPLTPTTFFMFLLPPIVLDAGYFMPNRLFFDNLGTILLFAVAGTVFNTLTIGVSLWAIGLTGLYGVNLHVLDSFLFSALVSAVDPVAVLAVFEEIQVNEVLYIVVFGESLLNDAVTVVLYHMFEAYTEMGEDRLQYTDVFLGFASFFIVALGGTGIGIIWGFLTGFVTRISNHVRVIEPLLVFVMAYLSYLTAEMFHLSGILAITFCGICAKNYVEANISLKSHTTVKYTIKMISSISETVIFLFLGVSTVNDYHDWNTWFVIFTILFCTVYRAIGVLALTSLANHFRLHKLNKVEEFVMAYGGLRGAVAFALAMTINSNVVHLKSMFVTATIAVVYFTVFVQGITIKPLVTLLRVKKSSKRRMTMNERIHERFMDHLMAGIEDIAGHLGNYHLRDKFKYYDNKYLRRWLVRDNHVHEPKILETFSKLNLRDAKEYLTQNGSFVPSNTNTDVNLSTLFRNYTQTTFEGNSSQTSLTPNDSSICNLDMQELDYSPSAKDLNDAKLHHILSDAMFKAPRKHRKYSRTIINEQEPHPPFRHMVRMQIRHMLSEQQRKNPKKGGKRRYMNGGVVLDSKDEQASSPFGNGRVRFCGGGGGKGNPSTDIIVTSPDDDLPGKNYYVNHALDIDEEGIVFTAPPTGGELAPYLSSGRLNSSLSPSVSTPATTDHHRLRTATETQLPWRRSVTHGADDDEDDDDDDNQMMYGNGDDGPVVQHEFPSWIDNRDYNAYVSPTSTFLNRLDPRPPPPVYNIFDSPPPHASPTPAASSSSSQNTHSTQPQQRHSSLSRTSSSENRTTQL